MSSSSEGCSISGTAPHWSKTRWRDYILYFLQLSGFVLFCLLNEPFICLAIKADLQEARGCQCEPQSQTSRRWCCVGGEHAFILMFPQKMSSTLIVFMAFININQHLSTVINIHQHSSTTKIHQSSDLANDFLRRTYLFVCNCWLLKMW